LPIAGIAQSAEPKAMRPEKKKLFMAESVKGDDVAGPKIGALPNVLIVARDDRSIVDLAFFRHHRCHL
jgi:hypothetical protein